MAMYPSTDQLEQMFLLAEVAPSELCSNYMTVLLPIVMPVPTENVIVFSDGGGKNFVMFQLSTEWIMVWWNRFFREDRWRDCVQLTILLK